MIIAVLSIEVKGFAELCRKLPRPAAVVDPYSLKNFRYLDPHKDRKSLAPPTALEILNLLTLGVFNYPRSLSSKSNAKYVVPRKVAVEEGAKLSGNARCLLVHSRLGNGKSIFLYLLTARLTELGYKCFMYNGERSRLQQELALVAQLPKVVILIDSYSQAQDAIRHLSEACPDAKFIVTVRTGTHDVRLHEIDKELPKPLARLSLNALTPQDVADLGEICRLAGLGGSDAGRIEKSGNELRDILIALFRSPYIQRKVEETFAPVFAGAKTKRVLLAIFLIHWLGERADPTFLRAVTHLDVFLEMAKFRETVGEIFQLENDELQIRSSIFAEYVIRHLAHTDDIVDVAHDIATCAAARKNERPYRVILGGMMQFSNLNRLLTNDPERLQRIQDLYEELRHHMLVNDEPLFWLQYAILMIERENLIAADEFLQTAYVRAAASPGFKTFQIDTQACRLLLLLEARDISGSTVRRFDEIVERLQVILSMLNEQSHRYHAIRVLEGVEPFIQQRRSALTMPERSALVFWISKLIEALDQLPPEVRAETGSNQVLGSLSHAKDYLVRV